MDRTGRIAVVSLLASVSLAGLFGGGTMIQTAQGSSGWCGWYYWYYLGTAAVGLGVVSLALLIVLSIRWRRTKKRQSQALGSGSDCCGDFGERLIPLVQDGNVLAGYLENFERGEIREGETVG